LCRFRRNDRLLEAGSLAFPADSCSAQKVTSFVSSLHRGRNRITKSKHIGASAGRSTDNLLQCRQAGRLTGEVIMPNTFATTGTLEDGRFVRLDETLPLSLGTVRLIVESTEPKAVMMPEAFEKMLRDRQHARGHQPRSKEELDAYLRAERESWDD
jgi:hypothetical protein